MTTFADYAEVYDLLYHDKDYAAEARFVHELLDRHRVSEGSILDLGCGTGLHAVELAAMGYRVVGVDISHRMIARAERRRRRLPAATAAQLAFREGDVRTLETGVRFDAVVSLFHVMSYQVEDEDIATAMRTARRHLAAGAPFVFDFWYGPAIADEGPKPREKRVTNGNSEILRITRPTWLPARNTVVIDYEVRVTGGDVPTPAPIEERHTVRYFFLDELERQLRASGFEPAAWGEWLTDRAPSNESFAAYGVAIAR